MINDDKTIREWKILLTMQINFISHKDFEETRNMHTKSRNIETMEGNERDKIIEELFESLLQNYQKFLMLFFKPQVSFPLNLYFWLFSKL